MVMLGVQLGCLSAHHPVLMTREAASGATNASFIPQLPSWTRTVFAALLDCSCSPLPSTKKNLPFLQLCSEAERTAGSLNGTKKSGLS